MNVNSAEEAIRLNQLPSTKFRAFKKSDLRHYVKVGYWNQQPEWDIIIEWINNNEIRVLDAEGGINIVDRTQVFEISQYLVTQEPPATTCQPEPKPEPNLNLPFAEANEQIRLKKQKAIDKRKQEQEEYEKQFPQMVAQVKKELIEQLNKDIAKQIEDCKSYTVLTYTRFSHSSYCEVTQAAYRELKDELLANYPDIKVGEITYVFSKGDWEYPSTLSFYMEVDWRNIGAKNELKC